MSEIKVYMELEFDGTILFSLNFSYVVYLTFFEFNLFFISHNVEVVCNVSWTLTSKSTKLLAPSSISVVVNS